MMTAEEFAATLAHSKVPLSAAELEKMGFSDAAEAAIIVRAAMPGIGFLSRRSRINCFMAVCRHLDQMIERGDVDLSQSQLILYILRLRDKKFLKAAIMFELNGPRATAYERVEMPRSAREYLAGMEYTPYVVL